MAHGSIKQPPPTCSGLNLDPKGVDQGVDWLYRAIYAVDCDSRCAQKYYLAWEDLMEVLFTSLAASKLD